jgi:NADPH-dependent curcumin reductase
VGQLARIAGARVVGIAGGPDKCRYVLEQLKFDAAVDHRSPDLAENLQKACPDGIDVYFENVGGAVWQAVLPLLNTFARVPVCGLIAQYSGTRGDAADLLPATMRAILTKSLTLRVFINYEFADEHYRAFLKSVSQGLRDGSITHAKTSMTVSSKRRRPSSACCAAKTSARFSFASPTKPRKGGSSGQGLLDRRLSAYF